MAKFSKHGAFILCLALRVKISNATPHQHPCRTFVLVLGMALEIKKLRKTHSNITIFPQNSLSRREFEGFDLDRKSVQK